MSAAARRRSSAPSTPPAPARPPLPSASPGAIPLISSILSCLCVACVPFVYPVCLPPIPYMSQSELNRAN
eukprot:scaffold36200_cov129-Isochrysis_galbana.AAC.1